MAVVEVQLLGSPRVTRVGVRVQVDTRKATALLAHLCLTGPRPRDSLADLLWPDADLAHARGALRRTLSALRGALGEEHLEATRDQVRIVRGSEFLVDVDVFRSRREQGDRAGAIEAYRGDFLDGFVVRGAAEFERWSEETATTLRRELAATLAELAREREVAGDAVEALALVRRWLAMDPLHEPAHQASIRLLAITGNRAAALVQYRECVRTLSRELGVPPLRETTELYEAINTGAFRLSPQPRPTAPGLSARAPIPAFVGRAPHLQALLDVHSTIDENGRIAVVEGEAGIGKSRLMEELAARLRRAGVVVARTRAYEDEGALPYRPVVDLLRERAGEESHWLRALDDSVLVEAERLVPGLAPDAATKRRLPQPVAIDDPGAAGRFLGALWETLAASVAGRAPGVLVIDDAQWADEATLRLLSFGLRRLAGRPLLLVLVWRTPHEHPLRTAATSAARDEGVRLTLGRLGESSVADLVRSVRGHESGAVDVRDLWETTEGVPLLLVEYLRTTEIADRLPEGAREALHARLAPVSETGRQVLSAAAVLGRSFDIDTVRSVSGRTEEETVAAIEELLRRGVVQERATSYDFDHELLRTVVLDETSMARRRLLHSRAAEVAQPAAVRARHLELAGSDADAAETHVVAGQQARALFAHVEALFHFRRALELGHPRRREVATELADVQVISGDYAGALVSLEEAAAAATPEDLSPLEHRLGRLHLRRGEYALAEAHLEAALSGLAEEDVAARASVTADRALAWHSRGEPERARALAAEAATLADRAGAPRELCQASNLLGLIAVSDGAVDDALVHLSRSRSLADELSDPELQVAALNNLALAYRASGDLAEAMALTESALEQCGRLGDRHREAALHNNLADLLHLMDRDEEAMGHLKTAVQIFAEVGEEDQPRPEIWKLVRW